MGDVSLDGQDLKALMDSVRPLRHRRDEAALLTVLCSVRRLVRCDRACWRWWALASTASTSVHVHDPADVGNDPDRAPCRAREMDHRQVIGVVLPSGPGERNLLLLSRGSGDVSDRDRTVLELLRPHLATALHGWRDAPSVLTPRQSQVMALVAEGLSDRQIARRLGLSESTVGKHLEQVYQRTGARSRVQAVRLCAVPEPALG
jgi:DNA-binding CsgD family transcriptional regulator